MKLALDSNRYVDFCRGEPLVVEAVRRASMIGLPIIVLAELRAGFRGGARSAPNERVLLRFLQSPRVSALVVDDATTQLNADMFVDLRRAGMPVPTNDVWIAAIVVQHGYTLLTRDEHFERIPRVPRL